MKRLALLAAVIAMMAFGASATVASAGNDTPGCQSATWDITITFTNLGGLQEEFTMPLQRCVPKGAHTDEFTFTGTADAPGFCPIAVGGTLKANDINMSWVDGAPCGGESSTFTGSLKWGQGTGSGDFTDNLFGPGTWTATRTS